MIAKQSITFLLGLASLSFAADDLAPLSDEFEDAATFANWQDLGIVEGWVTPSYELADVDTTEPGRFHIVPGALTWYNNLRGLLLFKEVTGDFVVTTRLRILSRHNPLDPTEVPNRQFSLSGIFVHGPRDIVQAAPNPYTMEPVWRPEDFGSDYVENTENYIFLSYGSAWDAGTRQFEIKATRNSDSRLYWASTGIDQSETEAWLQMVRVGHTVVCLRKHSLAGEWIVENRYPNPDHPFPDFGPTLQVGITAYTDWDTAAFAADDPAASYHFNYAPSSDGNPDLISQVDYFRFRRPDPALTEAVLQGMSVSYDPAAATTIDPPVLLSASPAAALYLGENANLVFDPYGAWRDAQFGDDAELPLADPGEDPDHDSLPNLLEFVLGGLPLEESSDVLPVLTVAEGMLSYSFTPVLDCGVLLEVEVSEQLEDWTTVATRPVAGGPWNVTGPGVAVEVDAPSSEVTVSFPIGAPSGFVRLAASLR